jgi:hypothetical protein
MNEAESQEAPREPLVIYATRGFDNYTFALSIESRGQILEEFGEQIVPTSRVTIALDTKAGFERVFGPIEPQVIMLLTGLSLDRLQERWQVEVRDSSTDRVLWPSPSLAA